MLIQTLPRSLYSDRSAVVVAGVPLRARRHHQRLARALAEGGPHRDVAHALGPAWRVVVECAFATPCPEELKGLCYMF